MPTNPLLVSWEADYKDGKTIAERDGWSYDDLPREDMVSFALVAPGETLLRTFCDGVNGRHPSLLVYRRRKRLGADTRMFYLLGYMYGEAMAFLPEEDRVVHGAFGDNSEWFVSPQPVGSETWTHLNHQSDVLTKRSVVHLPSGYDLKVNA